MWYLLYPWSKDMLDFGFFFNKRKTRHSKRHKSYVRILKSQSTMDIFFWWRRSPKVYCYDFEWPWWKKSLLSFSRWGWKQNTFVRNLQPSVTYWFYVTAKNSQGSSTSEVTSCKTVEGNIQLFVYFSGEENYNYIILCYRWWVSETVFF